jgi:putative hydrolase of the HAD superfamily
MSQKVGLPTYEPDFTDIILRSFRLRPAMIDAVHAARRKDLEVAILSDQTDWLDRLEKRDGFFQDFDRVFNSYYLGMGKNDPAVFSVVVEELGRRPGEVLFIDDNPGHVDRARTEGLMAWRFVRQDRFLRRFERILGF